MFQYIPFYFSCFEQNVFSACVNVDLWVKDRYVFVRKYVFAIHDIVY